MRKIGVTLSYFIFNLKLVLRSIELGCFNSAFPNRIVILKAKMEPPNQN